MNTRAAANPSTPATGQWRSELLEFVRAASGGLLFGVPLLYTMEVWWTGTHVDPAQMLAILALLMIPVFILNMTSGFRSTPDVRFRDAAADTVEAVAIGLVVTAIVLVLLREITPETPVAVSLGKVLYEAVPFCLGIGVARHFLQGGRADPDPDADGPAAADDDHNDDSDTITGRSNSTIADFGATTIGAIFVALSIAPTDEIPMIASSMSPPWLLTLLVASLVVSYAVVFVAGFANQDRRFEQEGVFQGPVAETVVCYLVSLIVAVILLWFFQRGLQPWTDVLARTIVLGFPAAVGGAAGRLAI